MDFWHQRLDRVADLSSAAVFVLEANAVLAGAGAVLVARHPANAEKVIAS
jgi:uncharacterized Fe-S cluster-containing radical SAM superfamily protein